MTLDPNEADTCTYPKQLFPFQTMYMTALSRKKGTEIPRTAPANTMERVITFIFNKERINKKRDKNVEIGEIYEERLNKKRDKDVEIGEIYKERQRC